jgi:Class II Aldolase and Adducin N-terminal domain
MSNFDALFQDLVIANRILASEDVVDAYGHVSVRHPDSPNRFLIARSLAPELVGPEDIVELDLDGSPSVTRTVAFISSASFMRRFSRRGQMSWPSSTLMPRTPCPSAFRRGQSSGR